MLLPKHSRSKLFNKVVNTLNLISQVSLTGQAAHPHTTASIISLSVSCIVSALHPRSKPLKRPWIMLTSFRKHHSPSELRIPTPGHLSYLPLPLISAVPVPLASHHLYSWCYLPRVSLQVIRVTYAPSSHLWSPNYSYHSHLFQFTFLATFI